MNNQLANYIDGLEGGISQIPQQRKKKLRSISDFIRSKLRTGADAKLTFICTHNSRRSHMCQIWAATLANYFGIEGIQAYSGGTEITAFNPQAVEAFQRAGFTIENPGGENPRYQVYYDSDTEPLTCYSKIYDDSSNPQNNYAAIMTCSDADQNCPVVPGTEFRITIPYEDPKQADGTPQEAQTYDERCRQIATEMYYMLSQLN